MAAIPPQHPPRRKKPPHRPGTDPVPPAIREVLGLLELPPKPKAKLPVLPKRPSGGRELFTDPEQCEAETEYAFQVMRARGDFAVLRSDIRLPQTTWDRNFSDGEYQAISWFSKMHAVITGGFLKLDDDGRVISFAVPRHLTDREAEFLTRIAKDRAAVAEYGQVKAFMPEAYLVILDWVSAKKYPQFFKELDEKMPSKVEIAEQMFASTDENTLRRNLDGFFKGVCVWLAHVRAERQTLQDRRNAVQQEYGRNRRLRHENG